MCQEESRYVLCAAWETFGKPSSSSRRVGRIPRRGDRWHPCPDHFLTATTGSIEGRSWIRFGTPSALRTTASWLPLRTYFQEGAAPASCRLKQRGETGATVFQQTPNLRNIIFSLTLGIGGGYADRARSGRLAVRFGYISGFHHRFPVVSTLAPMTPAHEKASRTPRNYGQNLVTTGT